MNLQKLEHQLSRYLRWLRQGWPSLLLLFVLLAPDMVIAEPEQAPNGTSGNLMLSVPLQNLMPEPAPITLRGADDQYDMFLLISDRFIPSSVELKIKYVNSISLLRSRSQLRVILNDVTIAQLPLQPEEARADVKIALPQLMPGFNRLTFKVAQHYTLECEDPAAPELWTEIDTLNSTLELKGAPRSVNASLAQLDSLMGPAIGNPWRYRILLPDNNNINHLEAGTLVSQAIGLRLGYREPVFLSATAKSSAMGADPLGGLDQSSLNGAESVLIGTRDELKPYLSADTINSIEDAFLAIYPLSQDPRYFVLVVSGRNAEEVKRAAMTLNFLTFPYNDSPSMLIHKTQFPAHATFGRKRFISTGREYKFTDLGYRTDTAKGSGYHSMNIEFHLPPDFYAPQGEEVRLSLDFSYGSSMREDSVLNIYLNDVFERAIKLTDDKGNVLKDYQIIIPLRSFKPGRNLLLFEPALQPLASGECVAVNERNLRFTLFDSSKIKFPRSVNYTAQPNLHLFSNTMFPYRAGTESRATGLVIASKDHDTLAATWTLLAKLAQVADAPLMGAQVALEVPTDDRHLLVVAPMNKLDPRIMAKAPLTLSKQSNLVYPVSAKPVREDLPEFTPPTGQTEQNNVPQHHGLMMAFASPFSNKRTVTIFTAASPDKLRHYVESLVTPGVWSQLEGDVALWTDDRTPVATQRAGNIFYVGDAPLRDRLGYYVSKSPWLWVAAVFGLIFILGWLTYILLNRRFIRRHGRDVRVED